jgi:hypothetical protein
MLFIGMTFDLYNTRIIVVIYDYKDSDVYYKTPKLCI